MALKLQKEKVLEMLKGKKKILLHMLNLLKELNLLVVMELREEQSVWKVLGALKEQ